MRTTVIRMVINKEEERRLRKGKNKTLQGRVLGKGRREGRAGADGAPGKMKIKDKDKDKSARESVNAAVGGRVLGRHREHGRRLR